MEEELTFSTREEFRAWLRAHGEAGGGVWLVFGKPGGRKTLKASEALEEALCFGWIDGRMQRIDDASYRKYFAPRRAKSVWSDKNKALHMPRTMSTGNKRPPLVPSDRGWPAP